MTLENVVLGHRMRPKDSYKITLWLGATVFVMMGLAMIAWKVDMSSMFIVLCIPTAMINIVWLKVLRPITGAAFNKLELLLLSVILFIAWAIVAALWLNAFESVVIALILLVLVAVICLLPDYAGKEINPERDERYRKINAYTGSDAYDITFVFAALIFMTSFFKVIAMSAAQGFALAFLLMLFARSVAMAYYNNRGDVE